MANEWKNSFWNPRNIVKLVILKQPKGMRGITRVYFVEHIDRTPACCLRSTGEMWIDINKWRTFTYEQKVFIILHENAHIVLNTSDEKAVDKLAHEQYMAMGLSLTKSVHALTRVLSYSTDEHMERTVAQLKRAIVYDVLVNKNKKLENYLRS
jgi:hypothetical protein